MVCFLFSPYPNPTSEFIQAPTTQCANLPFDPETVRILQLRSPCARCTRMGRYVSAFLTLMSFLASWLSPLATLAAVTNWFLLQSKVSRPPDSLSASLNHQFPCYYLVAFRPLSPRALSCSTKLRKMRERAKGGGGSEDNPMPVQTPSLLPAARLERALRTCPSELIAIP